jgi:hypothetical protein
LLAHQQYHKKNNANTSSQYYPLDEQEHDPKKQQLGLLLENSLDVEKIETQMI